MNSPSAAEVSPFNDWRVVSLSPLPAWALALIGAGLVLAVVFAWRGTAAEGMSRRRWTLFGLRAFAAVLAFLVLLEPGQELLATTKVRSRVAILVDQSRSMSLPAGTSGPTRAEIAAKVIGNAPDRSELESRFQVDVSGFGEGTWPLDPNASANGGAPSMRDAEHTYILPALEEAVHSGGSRPLAGIVLITDGADNGALGDSLTGPTDKSKSDELRARLKALGAPVFTLDPTGGEIKDLAVSAVKVDDFAFVRNTVEVDVELSEHGYSGLTIPVQLERQGQVVVSGSAKLHDGAPTHVKLSFIPDTTGEFAYTVRVPVQEGEAVTTNNSRSFVLKVIRDRVRVLHVAGRPSYDERFLRNVLKRDPNIDLISFFILKTPSSLMGPASPSDLSLIPFPTDEIFNQQLKTFDLIIFHNFNYGPYKMDPYLSGIAAYVRDGGALLMLGGDNSFGEGHYAETPIQDVLPVMFEAKPPPAGDDPFTPTLSVEGKRHPITALVPDEAQNMADWQSLPPVNGLNHTTLRPEAQALLQHPSLTDGSGHPMPVVAVWDVGRGRSMAVTTDQTWMWSFVSARTGRPQRFYDDFFHNAIRWLVRDPDLTQVRLRAEKERLSPSEPVVFIVKARDRDYGPATGARVRIDVLNAETGAVVRTGQGDVSTDGTSRIEIGTLPAGPYRGVATVRRNEAEIGTAEDAVVVEESGPELSRPAPRPDVLRFIADATEGQAMAAEGTRLSQLPFRDPKKIEIGQRKSHPIWDELPVLLVMCAVLGVEWFLRRRWGFF